MDYKEAVFWFEKAAKQGNPKAQLNLGLMYQMGLGVPKDEETALRWFRESAAQGYEDAKTILKELGEN